MRRSPKRSITRNHTAFANASASLMCWIKPDTNWTKHWCLWQNNSIYLREDHVQLPKYQEASEEGISLSPGLREFTTMSCTLVCGWLHSECPYLQPGRTRSPSHEHTENTEISWVLQKYLCPTEIHQQQRPESLPPAFAPKPGLLVQNHWGRNESFGLGSCLIASLCRCQKRCPNRHGTAGLGLLREQCQSLGWHGHAGGIPAVGTSVLSQPYSRTSAHTCPMYMHVL